MNWISVDERLPEFGIPVLATNINFENGKYWWVFERYQDDDFGWYWSRFEDSLDDAYADEYTITHWLPIPEIMKEEKEEG
ncbi:DUF551 domain-containing protein [Acinetobacter guillouiae]|uniref:DUF551 domain-containing protein n=1 Tax=Acinetobacter guillouiae TaxID=106649 RepID=UPI0028E26877|nr:DUF551 domain-containing protein [Acinetobacter guillouiae]